MLESFASSMNSLSDQLQQLQVQPEPSLATPAQVPVVSLSLPSPSSYNGHLGTCQRVLSQCSLAFEIQPSAFPTDRVHIADIITLLTSFSSVCNALQKCRGCLTSRRMDIGQQESLHLRQGDCSVSDYGLNSTP
ncbi:hypothetical protein GJAV_G00010510 [Gymnothorax javanicus]|nr:hypothetical protein GJAV_G00010510 [Gymnothorax javanicus]